MRRTGRRRSLRRNVGLECLVHSAYWDGAVAFVASDLSNHGIWLNTQVALEPGDEVQLSFVPPGPLRTPIRAVARVARVGERGDQPSGMGLSFTRMSALDRACLMCALEGLPPHLPGSRMPPALPRVRTFAEQHPAAPPG